MWTNSIQVINPNVFWPTSTKPELEGLIFIQVGHDHCNLVWTLRKPGKLNQLIPGCLEQGIEIIAIHVKKSRQHSGDTRMANLVLDFCSTTEATEGQGGSNNGGKLCSKPRYNDHNILMDYLEKYNCYNFLQRCAKNIYILNILIITGVFNVGNGRESRSTNLKSIRP